MSQVFNSLKNFSTKKRKEIGKQANLVKIGIKQTIERRTKELQKKCINLRSEKEKIDITIPSRKIELGHLHPLTIVQRKVIDIFQSMGFSIVMGPEMETEWYNFDALNVPKDHPARDIQDTLWIKQKRAKDAKKNFLLRTQTSPVQIRYMEKHNPPFKIIVPGRVFRNEATDASHECQFYQCEGLMVDKNISVANFKSVIEAFLKTFFNKSIKLRLRPGYFPFTEPSFEIDIDCEKMGWMEIMGAGMVHPNVLKAVKLQSKNWQGFAFGIGIDRLAMVKYKINDIRLFYSNDLRFLKQF